MVRDSFVGMALVLAAMAGRGKKVSELADELPRYEIVKRTAKLPPEKLPAALDAVESHFADAQADRLDGLRLDWPDRWLIVRGSNTEPIVRIIAEAPTAAAAEELVATACESHRPSLKCGRHLACRIIGKLAAAYEEPPVERFISFAGYFVMIGLAWLLSDNKRRFPWRVVIVGTLLQFALAVLILRHAARRRSFSRRSARRSPGFPTWRTRGASSSLASGFSSIRSPSRCCRRSFFSRRWRRCCITWASCSGSSKSMAVVMQKLMGVSGAESLSASANVFLGQTEAPLLVKPYIAGMTLSELNAVMIGGFANISGSLIAAFSSREFGLSAGHLVTASVISAPASLLIAKVLRAGNRAPGDAGHGARRSAAAGREPDRSGGDRRGRRRAAGDQRRRDADRVHRPDRHARLGDSRHRLEHRRSSPASTLAADWSLSALLGYLFAPHRLADRHREPAIACTPANCSAKKCSPTSSSPMPSCAEWQQAGLDRAPQPAERHDHDLRPVRLCQFLVDRHSDRRPGRHGPRAAVRYRPPRPAGDARRHDRQLHDGLHRGGAGLKAQLGSGFRVSSRKAAGQQIAQDSLRRICFGPIRCRSAESAARGEFGQDLAAGAAGGAPPAVAMASSSNCCWPAATAAKTAARSAQIVRP